MSGNQVVVLGAGPAGLSTALALLDQGVHPLVLDRAEEVAASWRTRYDRLRLNTSRPLSHLPRRRFPKGTPMFPTRDQFIDHLERHSREPGIEWRLGTAAVRIDRDHDGDGQAWVIHTSNGDTINTSQVVVATGYENAPLIPDWPGRGDFTGELLHSSEYRNPARFRGKSVLVVGPGCSGMEIAHDLATGGAARVWLSVRTPPNIMLRASPGPVPGDMIGVILLKFPVRFADAFTRWGQRMDTGDLSEYGLPVPEEGVFTRVARAGGEPTIVDKEVIEAIKARRFEVVGAVNSLEGSAVHLEGGASIGPHTVICATGYRRQLAPLVGHLGVLNERGAPRVVGGEPAADGLRFIGFVPRPGAIGYMAKEAKLAAKAIARELRTAEPGAA
jgi:cation diffusion facilitator CzcD-associated flavoprotein CzcO